MKQSNVMKALREATDRVNSENKYPDEKPLVMPVLQGAAAESLSERLKKAK